MHIQLFHNSYQQAGGEDVVVANEEALLRNHGHEVHLHSVSNDSIQGLWNKITTAWQVSYSRWGYREVMRIIEKTRPDVVHVHNFFPLLTASVYDACRDVGVATVQTLQNYRTICPGSLLMRNGKPCEDCIQRTPYQAVLHACYRGSRLGSLAVARKVDYHRRRGTWKNKVDRFVTATELAKTKFVAAGFPAEKIVSKPNFVEPPELGTIAEADRKGALFVGRISPEKGIETLLRTWETQDVSLRIVGEGPLLDLVKGKTSERIVATGNKSPAQVAEEMAGAAFLVMPSEWYEGFPMTLVESFAQGLPVIASRLGAMEEVIEDGVTGLHFTPGDAEDLARKVRWAVQHPDEIRRMGHNARRTFEQKYTPETNYRQLMAIYEGAIGENGSSNGST